MHAPQRSPTESKVLKAGVTSPLNIEGGMGLFEDGNDVLLEKSMRELADVHVLSLEHKLPVITKNENSPT